MDNDLSKHNFSDDIEHIKHALEDRGLELCGYFWGKPTSKTRNQTRFGRKGSKAFSTAGKYRGLCSDFELEEHGNLLQLIKREMSFSSWAEVFQWAKEWLGMPEHHSRGRYSRQSRAQLKPLMILMNKSLQKSPNSFPKHPPSLAL